MSDDNTTTEQTFTAAEVESLNQRAVAAEHAALRMTIAATYGINAEDTAALLTATDESGLTAQALRLSQLGQPSSGKKPADAQPQRDERQRFAAQLFGHNPDVF